MTEQPIKSILEAALFAAGKPLTMDHFVELFEENECPERSAIRAVLKELIADYTEHGIELVQVASGYRFQTKQDLIPWLKRLQPERSPRYSRALLETIAIIAYRQPITRADIEKIRGISVSTDLIKRLIDYNWIRVLAHRNTPGRPALYGTTREFLNYFNLKNLNDLPPLIELKEIIDAQTELLNADNPELDDNVQPLEVEENKNDEDSELLETVEVETQTELLNAENAEWDDNLQPIEIEENKNQEIVEAQTELLNVDNSERDDNVQPVEIEENKNDAVSEWLETIETKTQTELLNTENAELDNNIQPVEIEENKNNETSELLEMGENDKNRTIESVKTPNNL